MEAGKALGKLIDERVMGRVWDELNPKHPWSSDPWVWRVAFRRMDHAQN